MNYWCIALLVSCCCCCCVGSVFSKSLHDCLRTKWPFPWGFHEVSMRFHELQNTIICRWLWSTRAMKDTTFELMNDFWVWSAEKFGFICISGPPCLFFRKRSKSTDPNRSDETLTWCVFDVWSKKRGFYHNSRYSAPLVTKTVAKSSFECSLSN